MRKSTKKQAILGFIAESKNGRRFGEIQRFICELNGYNYDEFAYERDYNHMPTPMGGPSPYDTNRMGPWKVFRKRRFRGYYCTSLTGYWSPVTRSCSGMLGEHCTKVNGRYFIKDKTA